MILKEITCKSALTGKAESYTLNPYVGCQHGCLYCYATYIARWKNENTEWGTWVHIKTNIAEALQKQLQKIKPVCIFISTVCDAYQPVELKYKITRECLEVLSTISRLDTSMEVILLTKSDLVLRDIDILKKFSKGRIKVGFSVNTMNDNTASIFERNTPPPSRRLNCAISLKKENIKTGIFVNPILPYITERELPLLIKFANENNLDFIGFDTLNYITGHVGKKVRLLYKHFGAEAIKRFDYAAISKDYKIEVRDLIRKLTAGCKAEVDLSF